MKSGMRSTIWPDNLKAGETLLNEKGELETIQMVLYHSSPEDNHKEIIENVYTTSCEGNRNFRNREYLVKGDKFRLLGENILPLDNLRKQN
tara:strand:+ start:128 stop:400 length:273 start_codon:yes stop_codon:yes gene_type:complete